MGKLLFSAPARKFCVLALWAVMGAAADSGLAPEGVRAVFSEHTMLLALVALGLGHIAPEAAKK